VSLRASVPLRRGVRAPPPPWPHRRLRRRPPGVAGAAVDAAVGLHLEVAGAAERAGLERVVHGLHSRPRPPNGSRSRCSAPPVGWRSGRRSG
jgi:hypothetical protein